MAGAHTYIGQRDGGRISTKDGDILIRTEHDGDVHLRSAVAGMRVDVQRSEGGGLTVALVKGSYSVDAVYPNGSAESLYKSTVGEVDRLSDRAMLSQ